MINVYKIENIPIIIYTICALLYSVIWSLKKGVNTLLNNTIKFDSKNGQYNTPLRQYVVALKINNKNLWSFIF